MIFSTLPRPARQLVSLVSILSTLTACSGGSSGDGQTTPAVLRNWIPGEFNSFANFSNACANPRTGNDPFFGTPVFDRQGRVVDENNWLRSIHNAFYLWYDEILDQNPELYPTPEYYDLQKTMAASETDPNRLKDEFHFSLSSQDFANAIQAGVSVGYGAKFVAISSEPLEVVVAYIEPGSPAEDADLSRGDRIIQVDGVVLADVVTDGEFDIVNAGLFPSTPNQSHDFIIRDLDLNESPLSMISEDVVNTPVQAVNIIPTAQGNLGYLLFNDHVLAAEPLLVAAVQDLIDGDVEHVVLDLRYNGGGSLNLASRLAYMLAGDARTMGNKVFERTTYNDKFTDRTTSPITGAPLNIPFIKTIQNPAGSLNAGDPLPTLNAETVYIITTDETCSASESIINGLRGIDVPVVQIGSTTCGKPYGNTPLDNCGTFYLFTQFEGTNDKLQGGYSSGFKPDQDTGGLGIAIPGCSVSDDFSQPLGDVNEANLAAAVFHLEMGSCPSPPPSPPKPIGFSKINSEAGSTNPIKDPNKLNMKIVF
jgi:hypothetical protein